MINDLTLDMPNLRQRQMTFCGRELTRSKIIIDNKVIKQINTFNYLGFSLSYKVEKYIMSNFQNFLNLRAVST